MFGFKVVKRFRIEPANADVVVLAKGDLNVELFQANGATPLADDRRIPIKDIGTHGTKHVAFRIKNLDEFLVAVRAKGADVAVVERQTGLGPMCFLRDPAGTLIEFIQTT